jgi:NAD(P)-dependent dehydrogenase (short-subunit alcohol dehydrogenase family)
MSVRKSIFITGGGSGIGRAVAQHFAANGWFVGLADVHAAGLAETAALLPVGQSSTHLMDVTQRDQWALVLADFWRLAGERLDVLFNNAGVARGGLFADLSHADIDITIDVNFKGVVYGAEAGFQYLSQTPGACLLNTCSAAGLYGTPRAAVYSATKFGVRGLTEALDAEWAPQGIKVRSIMPSFIDTPLLNAPVAGSNRNTREEVVRSGLELTPVEVVAQTAWDAVHGDKVHSLVGKTARQVAFFARWAPGQIRKRVSRMRG